MNPGDWINWKKGGLGDYPRVYMIYDANSNLAYIGLAPRGSLTSAAVWVIRKYQYDGSNNMFDQTTSQENSILDNYLLLTYS